MARRRTLIQNTPTVVAAEEMAMLRDLVQDAQLAQAVINRYSQKLAAKYAVGPQDSLDLQTGVITRKEGAARG